MVSAASPSRPRTPIMRKTDVIVIGGGQSGLAMSRRLSLRGIDHLVLERGRVGERWHSERWRSLRLLTPNAHSALPGMPVEGDPDAFMSADAFAAYLDAYASRIDAPVLGGVEVTALEAIDPGFRVTTDAGEWLSRAVVIATGACDTPFQPAMAEALHASVAQVSPSAYRDPDSLPPGGVLVVGASSTGVQLAEEIQASGRQVTLAVGNHMRVPRRYRGRDVYSWMDAIGLLDEPALESGNLESARRQPSLQLLGSPEGRDLDLGVLAGQGVRLVGRLAAIDRRKVSFADDLDRTTVQSDKRMVRLLERIDDTIRGRQWTAPAADAEALRPFFAASQATTLDLKSEKIRSVVWATGYVRRYPWLKLRVLDGRGEIIHSGGVAAASGLFALGLSFMRRRRSSLIDGCGRDAEELASIVKAHLNYSAIRAA
jgi:putative flavoprotein involved in K+ transport